MGKSHAVNLAKDLADQSGNIRTTPEDLTKQALLDMLVSDKVRKRITKPNSDELYEYHSAGLFISEFGTMFRSQDQEMLATLNALFDCPQIYDEKRRYRGKDQPAIPHPQVSILAGTATGYLSTLFPAEAWSQGFMARIIMIYSGEVKDVPLFEPIDDDTLKEETILRSKLIKDLAHLESLEGQFTFTAQAAEALQSWRDSGMLPKPTAPRLENYNTRRIVHLLKLCMISSASRSDLLIIEPDDVNRAMNWMLSAELTMPQIFREMAGRGDDVILAELHHFAWAEYQRSRQKPIHKSRLYAFLTTRALSWQIPKIMDLAISSHMFKHEAGNPDFYIPQPKNSWGL